MMRSLRSLVPFLALSPFVSAQTTWYVDDNGPFDPFPGVSVPGNPIFSDPAEDGSASNPFDDLWKAVAAASSGDEIVVLPSDVAGAYFLSGAIDVGGKDLVIRSRDGAAVTVLDGTSIPGQHGVSYDEEETSASLLEGFTFRSFNQGTSGSDVGGAIEIRDSHPTIRKCVFEGNVAYIGAAILTSDSSSRIEDCVFSGNDSAHQGGAVYTTDGDVHIVRCTFEGNVANYAGALLTRTTSGGAITVLDSTFVNNSSRIGYAGAFAKFDGGTALVDRCVFLQNVADDSGGGAYLSGGTNTVRNSLFNANTALTGEGAMTGTSSGVHLVVGCTFHGNAGGGVAEDGSASLTLRNSIVWNNAPFEIESGVDVQRTNVLGGYAGDNLDVDPVFVDADGPDNLAGTLDDDFSLFAGSPCIDAGDTTFVAVGYPLDLLRRSRAVDVPSVADQGTAMLGLTVDLGAFEFQSGLAPQRFRR